MAPSDVTSHRDELYQLVEMSTGRIVLTGSPNSAQPHPRAPRPEDFGVTDVIISRHEAAEKRREAMESSLTTWMAVACVLLSAAWLASYEKAFLGAFIGAVLFQFLFVLPFALWGLLVSKPAKWIAHLAVGGIQIDGAATSVASYRAAIDTYRTALSEWERRQKEDQKRREDEERLRRAEAERLDQRWWHSLDGYQFETEVCDCLRRVGFQGRVTGKSGDGGIDIEGTLEGLRTIVQCKAHQVEVSPSVVRDLYGTMHHANAKRGIVVSLTGFTVGAKKFAHGKPILLVSLNDLIRIRQGTKTSL